jgi:hypothetical protein
MMQFFCKRCAKPQNYRLDAFRRKFEGYENFHRNNAVSVAKLLDLLSSASTRLYHRRDPLEHATRVVDEFLRIAG